MKVPDENPRTRAGAYPPVRDLSSRAEDPTADLFGVPRAAHLVPVRGTAMPKPGRQLKGGADVHRFMAGSYSSPVERFYSIVLDRQSRVLGVVVGGQGSVSGVEIHPREALAPAIEARGSAIIAVHNHPSGAATPSDADLALTRRLIIAGIVTGIDVLDHVVIGDKSFTSIRAERPEIWKQAEEVALKSINRNPALKVVWEANT